MLHLSPLTLRLRRLLGRSVPDFFATAIERWEVSPACEMHFPAAVMLPGQLDRIRRTEFGTMRAVRAMFQGDLNPRIGP
ncbi:MAG: glycosyltransferase family 61 protein, partial [Rhodobacteraceae bacterium]|nr:glycosyltransferase family 61 protein [Paracoccaceae bacterium]